MADCCIQAMGIYRRCQIIGEILGNKHRDGFIVERPGRKDSEPLHERVACAKRRERSQVGIGAIRTVEPDTDPYVAITGQDEVYTLRTRWCVQQLPIRMCGEQTR